MTSKHNSYINRQYIKIIKIKKKIHFLFNKKRKKRKNLIKKNEKQTHISLTRSEKVLLVLKHHERYKSCLTTADMHGPQTFVDNHSNPRLAAMAKRRRKALVQEKRAECAI